MRSLLRRDPDLTVSLAYKAWPFPQGFMARVADGLELTHRNFEVV